MEQEIRFCTSEDGVRIAFAIAGQGPPLVKVAHPLTHLEQDWKSSIWRHWLEALARSHTLVRYDERGSGLSDWDVEPPNLDAWVRDLEAVVDCVGLEKFPLLGIAHGAAVAIRYAVAHPERVSHLILYGGYLRGRLKRAQTAEEMEEACTLVEMTRFGWGRENPAFRHVFSALFMPGGPSESVGVLNELARVSALPEKASLRELASQEIDVTKDAAQVAAPTLVLHAQGDAIAPISEGRIMAATIPGARFVPLDSSNHILLESEPAWVQFLTEINRFLGVEKLANLQAASPISKETSIERTVEKLTNREQEILELVAKGYRNGDIARELYLSPKTVRNYISIIMGKLQVNSRGEAIVRAREYGFGREAS